MYKFIGLPNELVTTKKKVPMSRRVRVVPLLRFNADGEYFTEDEKLAEKLKRRFAFEAEGDSTGAVAAVVVAPELLPFEPEPEELEDDTPSMLPPMVAKAVRKNVKG